MIGTASTIDRGRLRARTARRSTHRRPLHRVAIRPPYVHIPRRIGHVPKTCPWDGHIAGLDARKLRWLADRTHRELTDDGVARISRTYHAWCGEQDAGTYADIPGFCRSAAIEEIRKHGHVLTPGRYVGAEAQEADGEPFEEKLRRLTATLPEQIAEARRLDAGIEANRKEMGYGG